MRGNAPRGNLDYGGENSAHLNWLPKCPQSPEEPNGLSLRDIKAEDQYDVRDTVDRQSNEVQSRLNVRSRYGSIKTSRWVAGV